jgi:sigma-B regulation protein RsbU (phosphoserine phosphatase)
MDALATVALEERLGRFRAFGTLRRALRVTEEVEEIALAAQRFALGVLGCSHFAIYCTEKEDSDFVLLCSSPSTLELPSSIERTSALAEQLATGALVREGELVDKFPPQKTEALALRGSPGDLIGVAIVAGDELDHELIDELVFDVESALSARLIARLRAEELAVLEIQERELVGLLRDVEARDEIIQRDLEEAREFQRKMLGAPPRVRGAAVEIVYQPLGVVGGDLYAVSVDGQQLRLFIADATGHGVRASLTTMFIKSGYEAVRRTARDPAALLAALNDAIARTYRSAEMLFSAACVDIDLATGKVLAASAAHPAICVVRRGDAAFMGSGGAFLGLRTGMKFKNDETLLEPGDAVYLYTDGFIEARKHNLLFGDDRLGQAIVEAHRAGTLAGEGVVAAVSAFLDGTPLDDDGTFLGVRYGEGDDEPVPSTREVDVDVTKL